MEPDDARRQGNWRYELKYRLDCLQYRQLRFAVVPYMRPDSYTRIAPGKQYLVRSLYFDTADYEIFNQKMAGDDFRAKYRIRTYSRAMADDAVVRVEIKVRKSSAMAKYCALVPPPDYRFFMRRRHWPRGGSPVLAEFERCLHLESLRPRILIEYFREGFADRAGSGLRITFDHRVRSAHADDLFPEEPVFFRAHHPHVVVLEIKGRRPPPDWLRRLVREQGLELLANSKFTQGILAARQDLYRPDGVVVIR